MSSRIILRTEGLTKLFGGLRAVDGVDFSVEKGEVRGLIGPNGAGKTTLINCVTGVLRPDKGKVFFDGRDITGRPPHEIVRNGIARTWQIVRPFRGMTVVEAVATGAMARAGSVDEALRIAEEILHELGFGRDLMRRRGSEITLMQHKIVDLARALATGPKLIFIDEIAAGLRPGEVEELAKLLRRVNEERGITMVVVEHLMTFIMRISDSISVMHEGKLIAEGSPDEVSRNPRVIEAYLGIRL
ncbi:MAG: ABC transporter ATP-binding protein [Desulfurococcaceae archaeon]